jgi:hypothetical protein
MQCRLGIARQPTTGRDMELWDSKSSQGRVTYKIPARILLQSFIAFEKFR